MNDWQPIADWNRKKRLERLVAPSQRAYTGHRDGKPLKRRSARKRQQSIDIESLLIGLATGMILAVSMFS